MDPDLGGSGSTGPDEDGDTRIRLKEQRFSEDEPDPRFVNTVYHESVHSEQSHISRGVGEDEISDPTTRRARLAAEDADEQDDIRNRIQDADEDEQLNAAYYLSPSEQEAHQAGFDVQDMYERVGAMHDELEGQERGSPMGAVDELEERLEAQRQEILQGTPEQARLEGEYAQPEGTQ